MGCSVSGAEPSAQAGHVITRGADSRIPYPTAQIEGHLSIRKGCLMINDGVAFWPAGTTWEADDRRVLFGGDFEDAVPAPVDSHFSGGGGIFAAEDDLSGGLHNDAEAAVRDCMARTGATRAVLVYPDMS